MIFFDNSRPDRAKRAAKKTGASRLTRLASSPVPPAKSYELFTLSEILHGGDRTLVFDVESYSNYFLVSFKCVNTKKVIYFEISPDCQLDIDLLTYVLHRFRIIGFNSRSYDLPMCMVACQGVSAETLKQVSDDIILGELRSYEVERKYNVKALNINHIDLIDVAPIDASLKIYSGRLHCERMQDLPFQPDTILTKEQTAIVRDYNINDLNNTELLFNFVKPGIELREELGREYNLDLRSKSDAQIAETVIKSELEKLGVNCKQPNIEAGWSFHYNVPDYIQFKTPQFQHALEVVKATPFVVGNGGSAICPQEIEALKPTLGSGTYRLGVGGLHSSEESQALVATAETLLIDRDVASYYPRIILNQRLFPEHLGEAFLSVFDTLVKRRLDCKLKSSVAKKAGDADQALYWGRINDALKIVINGTFGKLGNYYSVIYAPHHLLQVCMTGQLSLMMLIEMIELANIPVKSANTDGIVIACPVDRYKDLETIIMLWENTTGFDTEESRYKALYSRDVNNYIAVKLKESKDASGETIWLDETDGCKTKGVYAEVGSAQNSPLSKNPEGYISSMAVQALLEFGIPINETVANCGQNIKSKYYPTPISRFVHVRQVRGGAEKDGVYLGKAVRWYYAKDQKGSINYAVSGNQVPKSIGAKPLMIMPETLPTDLDIDHYVNIANEILYDIGYFKKAQLARFF
jgi:hypothetical protein